MKKIQLLSLFILCTFILSAQNKGWKSLFDGKTLNGFHQLNGKAKYEVVDGTIVGTTVTGEPNSFLACDAEYGDFILEVDLKVGEMNSGIQIRSLSIPEFNKGRVHGLQVEIDPSDRAWSGGIYDEARRGWMYQTEMNPAAKNAFKKNDWNKYRIEAIGSVIRTWVNDVPVSYMVDDLTMKGIIALQVHSVKDRDGGAQIAWKNIRIQTGKDMKPRPLDNTTPVANYTLNTLSPQEVAQGFSLLFNGKNLEGWKMVGEDAPPASGWVVNDCILSIMKSDTASKVKHGDLLTANTFTSYELNFDFKLSEGANSGVKYFVSTPYKTQRSGLGLEYQILDNEKHPDAKLGINGNRTLSSLYDIITAKKLDPRFQQKIGLWNQGKIIVHSNNVVEHWLNGFKVLEYTKDGPAYLEAIAKSKFAKNPDFAKVKVSPILLQDHGDDVSYKNIKIRKID